jgi:tetratricopeptide (TPR) repeat protein
MNPGPPRVKRQKSVTRAAASARPIVICLAGAAALLGSWLAWRYDARRPPRQPLPAFDATRADPHVARAIEAAREQALAEPNSAPLRGTLGMLFLAHEFTDEARTCFRQARLLAPRQFRWAYYLARLEEGSNLEAALGGYKEALALDDSYAPLHDRLARILARLDRADEARQHYQRAMQLAPESHFPKLGLARLALARGELEEARRFFEAAVEQAAWSAEAHEGLALVLRSTGELEQAQKTSDAAALLPAAAREMPDRLMSEVYAMELTSNRLARQADALVAQGRLGEAAEALTALAKTRPDQSRLVLSLGQVYLARQEAAAAVATLRDACARFPNDAAAHFLLGTALLARGNAGEAGRSFSKAVELKPDHAQAWYGLGQAAASLQDADAARDAFSRCVAVDPGLLKGWLALAEWHIKQGDRAAATSAVKAAERLSPNSRDVQRLLKRLE